MNNQRRKLLQAQAFDWIYPSFKQIIQIIGKKRFYQEIQLITPEQHYFSASNTTPYQNAFNILQVVHKKLFMTDWPLKLVIQHHQIDQHSNKPIWMKQLAQITQATNYSKTFRANEITVSIEPSLINKPQALINYYVLELLSMMVDHGEYQFPSMPINKKNKLKLLAIIFGFGIFIINNTFTQQQANTSLASSEEICSESDAITFALALFTVLKNIPHQSIEAYLKLKLHRDYKNYLLAIGQSQYLNDLLQ